MTDVLDRQIDIHTYFGLTYANYLVLHRSLLQSMPEEWQCRFVAMLDELDEEFSQVEKAWAYKVDAAVEWLVSDMSRADKERFGIEPSIPEPDGEDDDEWDDWNNNVEWFHDGERIDYFLEPTVDPVPHYNRGRTHVPTSTELAAAADHPE